MHFINENELDNWVRGNAELAQGLIVELVAKLVAASSPKPRDRRFPLGDSIGQHGPDGYLDAIISHLPFVPEGKSFWEIGTSADANKKATGDYNDLTKTIPGLGTINRVFPLPAPQGVRPEGPPDWAWTANLMIQ